MAPDRAGQKMKSRSSYCRQQTRSEVYTPMPVQVKDHVHRRSLERISVSLLTEQKQVKEWAENRFRK